MRADAQAEEIDDSQEAGDEAAPEADDSNVKSIVNE